MEHIFNQFSQQSIGIIVFALFLLLLFKNRILSKLYGIRFIHAEDAFDLFKTPAKSLFLDIRTRWELDHEPRIKASVAIPLPELKTRMDELKGKGLDRTVILICRSGSRAVSAGILLKREGFSDLCILSGGMNAWQRGDYPVTRPKKQIKRSYG